MTGYDLPAGVTDADIERRFGDPPKECVRCGSRWICDWDGMLCEECYQKETDEN